MVAILFKSYCVNQRQLLYVQWPIEAYFGKRNCYGEMVWENENDPTTGLIQSLRPANERRRYKVMKSLIGWSKN